MRYGRVDRRRHSNPSAWICQAVKLPGFWKKLSGTERRVAASELAVANLPPGVRSQHPGESTDAYPIAEPPRLPVDCRRVSGGADRVRMSGSAPSRPAAEQHQAARPAESKPADRPRLPPPRPPTARPKPVRGRPRPAAPTASLRPDRPPTATRQGRPLAQPRPWPRRSRPHPPRPSRPTSCRPRRGNPGSPSKPADPAPVIPAQSGRMVIYVTDIACWSPTRASLSTRSATW